eukprot:scaffold250610_cov30-Tisochrysis_lutea.AAC.20
MSSAPSQVATRTAQCGSRCILATSAGPILPLREASTTDEAPQLASHLALRRPRPPVPPEMT